MMKHNELAGGTWQEFGERNFPGPAWAYAVSNLPLVGWIGAIVIYRAHRSRRNDAGNDAGRKDWRHAPEPARTQAVNRNAWLYMGYLAASIVLLIVLIAIIG